MKKLITLVTMLVALGAIAQPSPLKTTPFTRTWLGSTNTDDSLSNLGIVSTNQTTIASPAAADVNMGGNAVTNGTFMGGGSGLTNLTPNLYRTEVTSTALDIPTHDGTNSVTHPSVLVLNEPLSGYTHWMVHTPYPFADREYVQLVASTDGVTWEKPVGATVEGVSTNMLFGLSELTENGEGWVADPDIHQLADGTFVVTMLGQVSTPAVLHEGRVYYRLSTNLLSWGAESVAFGVTNSSGSDTHIGCPVLVNTPTNTLRIYYIDDTSADGARLNYRESTDGTMTGFGAEVDCSYNYWTYNSATFAPWNIDINVVDDTYYGLWFEGGTFRQGGFLFTSTNGVDWTGGLTEAIAPVDTLIAGVEPYDEEGWYKASIHPRAGQPLHWDMWVGTWTPAVAPSDGVDGWKIIYYENIELPMRDARPYSGQNATDEDGNKARRITFVPPVSFCMNKNATIAWFAANYALANKFVVQEPAYVRYIRHDWDSNTGDVCVFLAKAVKDDHEWMEFMASVTSTNASAPALPNGETGVDLGQDIYLPIGEYYIGFWADNTAVNTWHDATGNTFTHSGMTVFINTATFPPTSGRIEGTKTGRVLLGIVATSDFE